jgi:hypothetical protein
LINSGNFLNHGGRGEPTAVRAPAPQLRQYG